MAQNRPKGKSWVPVDSKSGPPSRNRIAKETLGEKIERAPRTALAAVTGQPVRRARSPLNVAKRLMAPSKDAKAPQGRPNIGGRASGPNSATLKPGEGSKEVPAFIRNRASQVAGVKPASGSTAASSAIARANPTAGGAGVRSRQGAPPPSGPGRRDAAPTSRPGQHPKGAAGMPGSGAFKDYRAGTPGSGQSSYPKPGMPRVDAKASPIGPKLAPAAMPSATKAPTLPPAKTAATIGPGKPVQAKDAPKGKPTEAPRKVGTTTPRAPKGSIGAASNRPIAARTYGKGPDGSQTQTTINEDRSRDTRKMSEYEVGRANLGKERNAPASRPVAKPVAKQDTSRAAMGATNAAQRWRNTGLTKESEDYAAKAAAKASAENWATSGKLDSDKPKKSKNLFDLFG